MSWGHKITISIYVEGEHSDLPYRAIKAAEAADGVLREDHFRIDYVGASVEAVKEKPKGQA